MWKGRRTDELDSTHPRAVLELNKAVDEFRNHYILFTKNDKRLLAINEADLDSALSRSSLTTGVKGSATLFGKEIRNVMSITKQKEQLVETKWTTRVGEFCCRLYPVAKFSIQIAGVVGQV